MANDLSFNIVALDKAGATFIKLAEQVDHLSEKLDRLDRKDVTANVNIKTDESRKSLDSFTSRFQLLVTGIVAASPLAGAAIVSGIGAGFIAAAAIAEHSNADIQASYKGLWSDVVQTTKSASDQLVPQFVGAANQMDATVQRLGPDIARAMSFAGPDIVALTRGVDNLAQNSMPGVEAAMANSLPIFQGVATMAGQLGTDLSTSLGSIAQHATEYGTVVTTFGQITGTVLTGVVSLVNDIAVVWSQNSGVIVGDVRQIVTVITDLGQGALPLVSSSLHVAAEAIDTVVGVVGPLAPLLGTIGGVALVAFGAFKVAGVVTTGVNALANGVVTLAGNIEAGAAKAAAYTASMMGVEAESSAAAGAITAAGTAAATAGTEMGIGLSALAGPIGIVAGLAAGVVALGAAFIHTDSGAVQLSGNMDDLTAALERSHGAFDQAARDALQADPDFKAVAKSVGAFGVSSDELARALQGQGTSMDALRAKLQAIIQAHTDAIGPATAYGEIQTTTSGTMDAVAEAADKALAGLNGLGDEYNKSTAAAAASAASQNRAAQALVTSSAYQQAASGTARLLGVSLGDVTAGYQSVVVAAGSADTSVAATSESFLKTQIAVAQAADEMQQHFAQADQQVVQSTQAVTDAQHSYAQAQQAVVAANQGVANAAHSVEQAQRSLSDAYAGVVTAEQNYTKAQDAERQATVALNAAREQAIQDLKDLHLQLEDQVLSEEQARVKLFDAEAAAAGQGVTLDNARVIAGQQVTATNEAQMKAAFDLISAQNSLNDTLNGGDKLRKQVNDADRAGVDGAPAVISAQNALRNAQDQVTSSAAALTKAHQQVRDAQYGVQQASLALQKAHEQVADAEYQEQRAADQLRVAHQNLTTVQDAASRSLDIHTAAGRDNLNMILSLWDAITKSGLPVQQQYRTAVEDVAAAFGVSRDRAADYLKQLGLIPQDFKYSVTGVGSVDLSKLEDKWGAVSQQTAHAMATGGHVRGSGTGTSDDIPAWLSDGEYVVNAAATARYFPVLEAINSGRADKVPGFALGGQARKGYKLNIGLGEYGSIWQARTEALRAMGFPAPPDLAIEPDADAGGMIGYAAGAGVAQWAPQILQALAMLGQSAGWLGTVERRMNQESGGNPNAVNRWDSNWAAGHPSVGLMQVIRGTYAAYRGPDVGPYSYGVSVDPLSNIFAGLNYAVHRYGSLSALNRPGGYDSGGWLTPGAAGVNGLSRPEAVLTPEQSQAFVQLAKTAASGKGGGNTYVLNVYNAANNEINLRAQFQRMEAAAGIL